MFEATSSNVAFAPARTRRLAGLIVAALLLVAGPAQAARVFFDHLTDFGVSAESAMGSGLDLMVGTLPGASAFLDRISESPQLPVMGASTMENPNLIATSWTVANISSMNLENLYVAFAGPYNYNPTQIGLEVPDDGSWVMIQKAGTDTFRPAVSVGDLAPGETATFSFTHLLAVDVMSQDMGTFTEFTAPGQYLSVSINPENLPEPVSLLLLGSALVGFALWRRKES